MQVFVAISGPIGITFFTGKIHWFWKCHMILALMVFVVWINYFRTQMSKKLSNYFSNLQTGSVLGSRIPNIKSRYVVTRSSSSHYHLKALDSGRQMLVPKSRVQDEFELLH